MVKGGDMFKNFERWISSGVLKTECDNDRAKLKKTVSELRKNGWPYHLVVETAAGKVLFSNKEPGCFVPYVIHEKLGRTGRMAYAERSEDYDIYIVAFEDDVLQEQFLIKEKETSKLAMAKLYLKNFLSETGIFLLEERLSSEFADFIEDDGRYDFVEPIISDLVPSEKYRFIKADLVINPYSKYQKMIVLLAVVFSILMVGGYQWYESIQAEKQQPHENVDPYLGLKEALTKSKPNTKIFLAQLAVDINRLRNVPDWSVVRITATEKGSAFEMATNNGTHHDLERWCVTNGFQMTYAETKVVLLRQYNFLPVLAEPVLAPVDGLVAYISDATKGWWDDVTIAMETSVTNQQWIERIATINFKDWNEYDLDTLGSLLTGKPYSFLKAEFINTETGLSGSVSVVVYGGKK